MSLRHGSIIKGIYVRRLRSSLTFFSFYTDSQIPILKSNFKIVLKKLISNVFRISEFETKLKTLNAFWAFYIFLTLKNYFLITFILLFLVFFSTNYCFKKNLYL